MALEGERSDRLLATPIISDSPRAVKQNLALELCPERISGRGMAMRENLTYVALSNRFAPAKAAPGVAKVSLDRMKK